MAEFDVSSEGLTSATGGATLKAFEDPDLDGKIFPSFDTPKSVEFRSHVAVSEERPAGGCILAPPTHRRRDVHFHLLEGGSRECKRS